MSHTRTRIKFCGITRAEDLELAVALGVDAVGFVCVPASRRFIAPEDAAALRRHLPPFVSAVALLSDPTPEWTAEVQRTLAPDWLQFHGRESAAFCESAGARYLKAVSVHAADDVIEAAQTYAGAAALLLDSHAPGGLGGTGQAFDWSLIPRDVGRPLVLAGGLTPANVAQAITMVRPYAVDVSSGIESAPGAKDATQMRAFVEAVRLADAAIHSR
jgi:phosphoribosylanthranilate isomerase